MSHNPYQTGAAAAVVCACVHLYSRGIKSTAAVDEVIRLISAHTLYVSASSVGHIVG